MVSLVTAALQLLAPSVYVERELRYSSTQKSQPRWRLLGAVLFLATPIYVWLYFHFSRAGWVVLSVAMTYIAAAESWLRSQHRESSSLRLQSFFFAGLNIAVALGAIFYMLQPR